MFEYDFEQLLYFHKCGPDTKLQATHCTKEKKILAKTGSVRNHQPISPYDHAASPQWDKISVTVYYRNLIRCLLELCN